MQLLISFVNQNFSKNLKLAILDLTENKLYWIDKLSNKEAGCTGIAFLSNHMYVCLQNGGLLTFNNRFEIVNNYEFTSIKDPHSLYSDEDGRIFCVSSGTNQIYEIKLDERGYPINENEYWSYPDLDNYDEDIIHLNSTVISKKYKLASFFGIKSSNDWNSAISGGIIDLIKNDIVFENIVHPHSLFEINGELFVLESKKSCLHCLTANKVIRLPEGNYLRGIDIIYDNIYLGMSSRRNYDKIKSILVSGRTGEFENKIHHSTCRIGVLSKKEGKLIDIIDLSPFANEIYDINVLPKEFIFKPLSTSQEIIRPYSYKSLVDRIISLEITIEKILQRFKSEHLNLKEKLDLVTKLNNEKVVIIKAKNKKLGYEEE